MGTEYQWKRDQLGNGLECDVCLAIVPTATFSGRRLGEPRRDLCQLCATTRGDDGLRCVVNGAMNRIRLDLDAFKDAEHVTVEIDHGED